MVSLGVNGSTRSGRTYLPDYIECVPAPRREVIIGKLLRSNKVEVENLSDIIEIMSIYRTTPMKPKKTLREYSAPSSEFLKQPIEFPNPGVREYRFDGGIIKIL